MDSLDFQVQRRLHDTDVLFTDRIHDVHVCQDRFGIVGLAEHRGSYSEATREHPKQAKGRYRFPAKLIRPYGRKDCPRFLFEQFGIAI